jgi:hypothetical protein
VLHLQEHFDESLESQTADAVPDSQETEHLSLLQEAVPANAGAKINIRHTIAANNLRIMFTSGQRKSIHTESLMSAYIGFPILVCSWVFRLQVHEYL